MIYYLMMRILYFAVDVDIEIDLVVYLEQDLNKLEKK